MTTATKRPKATKARPTLDGLRKAIRDAERDLADAYAAKADGEARQRALAEERNQTPDSEPKKLAELDAAIKSAKTRNFNHSIEQAAARLDQATRNLEQFTRANVVEVLRALKPRAAEVQQKVTAAAVALDAALDEYGDLRAEARHLAVTGMGRVGAEDFTSADQVRAVRKDAVRWLIDVPLPSPLPVSIVAAGHPAEAGARPRRLAATGNRRLGSGARPGRRAAPAGRGGRLGRAGGLLMSGLDADAILAAALGGESPRTPAEMSTHLHRRPPRRPLLEPIPRRQ